MLIHKARKGRHSMWRIGSFFAFEEEEEEGSRRCWQSLLATPSAKGLNDPTICFHEAYVSPLLKQSC
ncbi:hypothetical protein HZH66_001096 [Vespula vulgaris]|uniref:Uncharacterized protein n=1 Tax=Vespula vulgaris TaxID=7454 RepID=A0A834NJ85_VESVU|nr:hypothetical protein HZH66_001096 [Vespula vulgaris]